MNGRTIGITVNGESQRIGCHTTVAQLLAQMDVAGKRVAVERNGEIVPKSQHVSAVLAEADRLEIVIAVGGG
jgi:sulfur carrier protein